MNRTRAYLELLGWLVLAVLLAWFGTATVREIVPYLVWTPLHVLPFAVILLASYRAGSNRLPTWPVVTFGLLCTIGFLPLLLPDTRGRAALDAGMVTVWFYVARTATFTLSLPVICAFVAILGRRRAQRKTGHCSHCSYNLTGNASGRCPECGEVVSVPDQRGRDAHAG
ncbi:MAG: hypothetical protein PVJ57_08355 [Phycisphaerae bacterium]